MTPKEKAQELFRLFHERFSIRMDRHEDKNDCAKECVLICVDEILALCWNGNKVAEKFWHEVKQEIENL